MNADLADLRIGDRVAIEYTLYSRAIKGEGIVTSITRTRIVVGYGPGREVFRRDGGPGPDGPRWQRIIGKAPPSSGSSERQP